MDLFTAVANYIDMRSFSTLWYWIVLAVVWSMSSHWVMGVPFHVLQRARRRGGQDQTDVEHLARIYAGRMVQTVEASPFLIVAIACFWLTMLGVLGFYYEQEFAQALMFLVVPMVPLSLLSLRCARQVLRPEEATGAALYRRLTIHRRMIQVLGMVSVFFTAMWGAYQNYSLSIIG